MTQQSEIRGLARGYLDSLNEETMLRAWGERTDDERVRLISAAVVLGRGLESRLAEEPQDLETSDEGGLQRLLISLLGDMVRDLAAVEGASEDEVAEFLGETGTRDRVLELDEVLGVHEETGRPLDALLLEAVEERERR